MTVGNFNFKILKGGSVLSTYVEKRAKNRQPGLKNVHAMKRTAEHVSQPGDKECFYFVYHAYLDRCPADMTDATQKIKSFQHPVKNRDPDIWLVFFK